MIFCLRQLQEKCIEHDRPHCRLQIGVLYCSEDRSVAATEDVWMPREVRNYDIKALHTGMMANVSVGGVSFSVMSVVKQDCVLAPTLLSIFLSAMLNEAFRDTGDVVYIYSSQCWLKAGKIYRAIVLSTLLYGAETWTVVR